MPKTYQCCGIVFNRKNNFSRHVDTKHGDKRYFCPKCHVSIQRKDNLKCHLIFAHRMTDEGAFDLAKSILPASLETESQSTDRGRTDKDQDQKRKKRAHHSPPPVDKRTGESSEPGESGAKRRRLAKEDVNRKRQKTSEATTAETSSKRPNTTELTPNDDPELDIPLSTDEPINEEFDGPWSTVELIHGPSPANSRSGTPFSVPSPSTTPDLDCPMRAHTPFSVPSASPTPDLDNHEGDPSKEWKPEDQYEIKLHKRFHSPLLKTEAADYQVKMKPFESNSFEVIQERLEAVLDHALNKVRENVPLDTRGRIAISLKGLKDKYINTRFGDLHKIKASDLLYLIEKVLNSNEEASLDEFSMHVIFAEWPAGGERGASFDNRDVLDAMEWGKKKRCLINAADDAPDGDQMCLARCLVVGKHMADHGEDFKHKKSEGKRWWALRDSRRSAQEKMALRLHEKADVNPELPSGPPEIQKFQDSMKSCQIIVYQSVAGKTEVLFPQKETIKYHKKRIYLWLHEGHYWLINPKQMAGFHGAKHFCHKCMQYWNNNVTHKCKEAICRLCSLSNCTNTANVQSDAFVHCKECNRDFSSVKCRKAHEEKQCKKEVFCTRCWKVVPRKKQDAADHGCLQNYCKHCKEFQDPGHRCYVQTPKKGQRQEGEEGDEAEAEAETEAETETREPAEAEDVGIEHLFGDIDHENGYEDDAPGFDTESGSGVGGRGPKKKQKQKKERQFWFCDIESQINDGEHTPILLCVLNEDGTTKHQYIGSDCVETFFKELYSQDHYLDSNFVFHNFSGYDGLFILRMFYKHCVNPNALFRGSRPLTMSIPRRNITFMDSLLQLTAGLSSLPKAFGIKDCAKGFFPHLLNTKENRGYRGKFPAFKYFDPDNLLPDAYQRLKEWYDAEAERYRNNPDLVYCLEDEMIKYCWNDCDVLRLAVQKYRETMKSMYSGLDPFNHITLPSYINYSYRTIAMPIDSLAILPQRGYSQRGTKSLSALCWLLWEAKKRGLDIKHGRNSKEVKFGPYFLDGFAIDENGAKIAFEFNGCEFHGHTCLGDRDQVSRCNGKTYGKLEEETLRKEKFLLDRDVNVVTMYSCDFKYMQRQDPELKEFVREMCRKLKEVGPLAPRDALRGGRTNSLRLMYTPKEGESIFYMDFTSLYPAVNSCVDAGQAYPIGHPTVYLHDFPPVEEIFGLIKCRVQPPKDLFLPVLPVYSGGKVIFGLCNTCIEEGNTSEKCTHTTWQRAITDTWVSEELKLAVKQGYVVEEIYEAWHFTERSTTLFRDFLQPAYVQKVQASGWPGGNDMPEEDKRAWIKMYKDEQGIDIDYDSVEVNDPKKSCSKLQINNFWGYLGKDGNPPRYKMCTKYSEFLKIATDKKKQVVDFWMPNKDVMFVAYIDAPGSEQEDSNTSVVSACFTTSLARIKLYQEMDKLGDRVLYFDTDSIIWVDRPNEPGLKTGPLLGQFTDEIYAKYGKKYGDNAMISAYSAAGPKTYSLLIDDKRTGERIDTIMKCKGVRLTVKACQTITPETFSDLVREQRIYEVPQSIITRNKKTTDVRSRHLHKQLRVTFSKRLWPESPESPSLPIGWKDL